MKTTPRLLGLYVAGCFLAALAGCARSSVAVNNAAAPAEAEKKADAAPAPAAATGEPFKFPDDRGGKMLGELLAPSAQSAPEARLQPRPLPPPASVGQPEVPLQPTLAELARPPLVQKTPPPKPHTPAEDLPLVAYRGEPVGPNRVTFSAGAPVSIASPDVAQPTRLPYLGQPGVDRVPVEDPTVDESLKAALAGEIPVRATPAPFDRRSVPDPFENAQTIRLKTPPAEDTTPSGGSPLPPR